MMTTEAYGQIPDSVLRGLLGSLGDGLILTDLEEKITYINKSAKRILDRTDKQALGYPFGEVCPLVNLKTGRSFQSSLQTALQEQRSVGLARNIGILRGEQKEAIYLSATCSPLQLDKGEIVGCAVILRNITHLRRLEVRIEADHVYMRTVFINESWNEEKVQGPQSKAVETDISDIASLLAYCEQRLDDEGGDAS